MESELEFLRRLLGSKSIYPPVAIRISERIRLLESTDSDLPTVRSQPIYDMLLSNLPSSYDGLTPTYKVINVLERLIEHLASVAPGGSLREVE